MEMVRDLRLPIDPSRLVESLKHSDPDIVRRSLEVLNTLGHVIPRDVLLRHLTFDTDVFVLREVLRALERVPGDDLIDRIRVYASHDDPGVASPAVVWLKRVAGYK